MFKNFEPISLKQLNLKASLLSRRDRKYLLSITQLEILLSSIQSDYSVLKINDNNKFIYDTYYLDTPILKCFLDHNKDRRKRFKLRFRHYVDSDTYYLEIKLKGLRELTHKYRRQINSIEFEKGILSKELKAFVNEKLILHYKQELDEIYSQSLRMKYCRTTLVSKINEERITIDNTISFNNAKTNANIQSNDSLWLVEIKSRTGRSVIDKKMFQLGARPVTRCSKYCLGISLTKYSDQVNSFTRTSKRFMSFGILESEIEKVV